MSKHPWAIRRSRIGYTQVDIADHLNVSRQFVIRLEKSLFHEVSDYVITSLSELFNSSPTILMAEYRAFSTEVRAGFRAKHPSFKEVFAGGYLGEKHPLVYYRERIGLSRMGLCKGLCLDYGPISDYEMNKQRGLPLVLKLAAQEIYWDWAPLESAVAEWRSDGRADRASRVDLLNS